jgi:hypothetical protein
VIKKGVTYFSLVFVITMSSEELAEIPQPESLETTCGSKRPRQRVCELLNQQNLIPNGPLIELESGTNTNNQHKTGKNNKKRNKVSTKTDLNKITDQLVLIPNAKPPGQSWIWAILINMNQLNNTEGL